MTCWTFHILTHKIELEIRVMVYLCFAPGTPSYLTRILYQHIFSFSAVRVTR